MNASQKKILIVEDEQLIAHSIERSLCKAGYSVPAMAASAEEALEKIEQTDPDLVLMDIHIQGPCDGVETARVIREKYHLPVIYLTAHADTDTLERAKITEPLGYLVKPVNHANLPSSIEMALYKHQVDRQLAENRALLATILGSIAEAVIVADSLGQIQFLNRAAENLTGWSQDEAYGQNFESMVGLDSGSETRLLLKALATGQTLTVPRDTTLRTKAGLAIFVDGHIAISSTKGRAAGAMITLHDASVRRDEEQRLRQEQRMLSVGQMANDIANDFYGLFDLISSFSDQLLETDDEEEAVLPAEVAGYISRASRAGVTLARQLVDLGSSQKSRPALISLNQILADRQSLYNHICGAAIVVETDLCPSLDLVLNHSLHIEKLVLNLVLSAKHSMPYGGKVVISTANISCPGEKGTANRQFVRMTVEAHRNPARNEAPSVAGFQAQSSELTMTVVNAIVAVSEGTINAREISHEVAATEVLLPAIASRASQTARLPETIRHTVMAVGVDPAAGVELSRALEERGVVLLQAANTQEASLIAGFIQGSVDLAVLDGGSLPPAAQRSVIGLLASRWPAVRSLVVGTGTQLTGTACEVVFTGAAGEGELACAVSKILSEITAEDRTGQQIATLSAALLSTESKQARAVLP